MCSEAEETDEALICLQQAAEPGAEKSVSHPKPYSSQMSSQVS